MSGEGVVKGRHTVSRSGALVTLDHGRHATPECLPEVLELESGQSHSHS
jgi:hypothetical protein